MLDQLQWNYQLWRDARAVANGHQEYDRRIRKAQAQGAGEQEIEEVRAEERYRFFVTQEQRLKLISSYLVRRSTKLLIPVQFAEDDQERWVHAATGGYYLTPAAIEELGSKIREAEKERSEILQAWAGPMVSVAAAFTGLLGTVIGLLAWLAK